MTYYDSSTTEVLFSHSQKVQNEYGSLARGSVPSQDSGIQDFYYMWHPGQLGSFASGGKMGENLEGCTWEVFVGKPAGGPCVHSHFIVLKAVTGPHTSAREARKYLVALCSGEKESVL